MLKLWMAGASCLLMLSGIAAAELASIHQDEAKPLTMELPISPDLSQVPVSYQGMLQQTLEQVPRQMDLSRYPSVDPDYEENLGVLTFMDDRYRVDENQYQVGERLLVDYQKGPKNAMEQPPFYGVRKHGVGYTYFRQNGTLVGVGIYQGQSWPKMVYTYLYPEGVLTHISLMFSEGEGYVFNPDGQLMMYLVKGKPVDTRTVSSAIR